MSLIIIFTIFIVHWFANFIMQDEKWAVGKSKSLNCLISYTLTYSLLWGVVVVVGILTFGLPMQMLWFVPITFVAHTITDYFTSKVVSKMFANGKYGSPIPNLGAFSMIGFDQVLHYAQLFLTYHLLQ
jgi:hypothetical protein